MKTHLRAFSEGCCVCVTRGDESLHGQQEVICVKLLQQVEVATPSAQAFRRNPPSSFGPGAEAVHSQGVELWPAVVAWKVGDPPSWEHED